VSSPLAHSVVTVLTELSWLPEAMLPTMQLSASSENTTLSLTIVVSDDYSVVNTRY